MCSSKSPKPAPAPAPAPAPPLEAPVAPILNETASGDKNTVSSKRGGRNSLRIDLAEAAPAGDTGLNIPTA